MYNAKKPPVSEQQSDTILATIAVRVAAHPEELNVDVLLLALDSTKVFLPGSMKSLVNSILDARFAPVRQEARV